MSDRTAEEWARSAVAGDDDAALEAAKLFLQQDNEAAAHRFLVQAYHGGVAGAAYLLGTTLLKSKKRDDQAAAVEHLTDALFHEDHPSAGLDLAHHFLAAGDFEEALKWARAQEAVAGKSVASTAFIKRLRLCHRCDTPGASKICGRCKRVRYCTPKCQREDWREHKEKCRDGAAGRGGPAGVGEAGGAAAPGH
jgi:hypothetical protein